MTILSSVSVDVSEKERFLQKAKELEAIGCQVSGNVLMEYTKIFEAMPSALFDTILDFIYCAKSSNVEYAISLQIFYFF